MVTQDMLDAYGAIRAGLGRGWAWLFAGGILAGAAGLSVTLVLALIQMASS
ncbi:hypothetical protein V5F40_22790 [Xanthobacter sp. DSM 14520]|uniref:hypothetical protein n=1 Tax=Xanthobacter autotrophicus (strain ATCC BAA-1158 / Py2) TaxID=78245 RepID=UPI00372B1130